MKLATLRILATAALLASVSSHADLSANVGWASDYHFRGIFQSDSSASAGIDFENGGWYVGAWTADVDDGLEVDGYFGYGGSYGDFNYGVGFTGYYYTGDFDDTYQEINLSAGYSIVTLDVAIGEYENFSGPTQDYTFVSLTGEYNNFYATYGTFSNDADGDYFDVGYGREISGFDVGVSLIFASSDLIGQSDESLVFTIGKSFSF